MIKICPITGLKMSFLAKGRIGVFVPNHPKANNRGYVLRSRYVIEKNLGRFLNTDEHIHHKDENKLNDIIENLELLSRQEHSKKHLIKRIPKRGSIKARRIKTDHGLDYEKIKELMNKKLGYRKISKILKEPLYCIKQACIFLRG